MKNKVATMFATMVAIFALAANANTTYYFQGAPAEETVITGGDSWKDAGGNALELFVTGNEQARDRTVDAVITNGQIAVTSAERDAAIYRFKGGTLSLYGDESEAVVGLRGAYFSSCDIVFGGNGTMRFYGQSGTTECSIGGSSTVLIDSGATEAKPAKFTLMPNNSPCYCHAPISGTGCLKVDLGDESGYSGNQKQIYFYGDNSSFTGVLAVEGRGSVTNYVIASNANSFGGNPAEYLEKGIWLKNNGGLYMNTAVTIPANRGIYIDGCGVMTTPSTASTVDSPLKFASADSVLVKTGSNGLFLYGGIAEGSPAGIVRADSGILAMRPDDVRKVRVEGSTGEFILDGPGMGEFGSDSGFSGVVKVWYGATLRLGTASAISPSQIRLARDSSVAFTNGAATVSLPSATLYMVQADTHITVSNLTAGTPVAALSLFKVDVDGSIDFDEAPAAGTVYKIFTTTTAMDASVPYRLTSNVKSGMFSLSSDGKTLQFEMLNTWTGAVDGDMAKPGNWSFGTVPGEGDTVLFSANGGTLSTDNLPGDFKPAEIILNGLEEPLSISGAHGISGIARILNNSTNSLDLAVSVDFGDGPIDVTEKSSGHVIFSGGVTGTKPVNHATFYGNYNITVDEWELTANVHLAENSHLECKAVKLADRCAVSAGRNAQFIVNGDYNIIYGADDTTKGYGVVNGALHEGVLWVKGSILPTANNSRKVFRLAYSNASGSRYDGFSGLIKVDDMYVNLNKSASYANFNPGVANKVVLSVGRRFSRSSSACNLYFMNDFRIGCHGDYALQGQILGEHAISPPGIRNNNIEFVTSDTDDPTVGHTVTIDNRISGSRQVTASGCGKIVWSVANNYTGMFTGGFVASNGVTVVLVANRAPGSGPVTMKSGTTLAVTNSVTTGGIGGSGNVTFEPDSAIAFNFSSTSKSPVLAFNGTSSLVLPAAGKAPLKVKITADNESLFRSVSLSESYVITSGGKFTADDISSGKVVLDAEGSSFWVRSIGVNADGNLCVYTRAPGLSISVR